jgi:hypothetical protein
VGRDVAAITTEILPIGRVLAALTSVDEHPQRRRS